MFFRNLFNRPRETESNIAAKEPKAPKAPEPVQIQLLKEEGLISNGREAWRVKAKKGVKPYDFIATCIYNDMGRWRVMEATASLEEGTCKEIDIQKLLLYNGNVCFFIRYTFRSDDKYAFITCRKEGDRIRFSKQDLGRFCPEILQCIDKNCSFVVIGNKLYGMKGYYCYCHDFVTGETKKVEIPSSEGSLWGVFYYNGYLYTGDRFVCDKVYRLDLANPEKSEGIDLKNVSSRSWPYQWDENNFIYKNRIYSRKGDLNYLDLNVMEFDMQTYSGGLVFLGMVSDRYLLVSNDTDTNQVVRGYSLYDLEENQRIMFDKKRFQCKDLIDPDKKVMIAVKNVVYIGETAIFFYTKGKRVKEVFYSAVPFRELKDGTAAVVDFEIVI